MRDDVKAQQIELLAGKESRSWAEDALLACLARLVDGGPTHAELVRIVDAWVGPGDEFSVVYVPPWGDSEIGLRRSRQSETAMIYSVESDVDLITPAEFGQNVADFDLGVPFGADLNSLWADSRGTRWYGDSHGMNFIGSD